MFEAQSVPFEKLSADDFEKCVFACFLAIQSHQGLVIDGQPAGSGDGGFDVYGVVVDSKRKLCVQCKRQKGSLGLPLLAKEVAKVALTTHLEKSDVGVHFFICTGGVTRELRRILRETDRTEIVKAAKAAISEAKKGELKTLRDRLPQDGLAPEEIVALYVRTLDRLVAWDTSEFDAALSTAWDSAFQVIERFFRVSTAVREHPRALFNRDAYQEWCRGFSAVVNPQLEEGELPAGLVEFSGTDPSPQKSSLKKDLLSVNSLAALEPGEVVLVTAEGGAGKTTLLELVRAEVAQDSSSSMLSVLITCSEYVPGGLDSAVHAQLGVQSGSWRMLPDKIQILCDGINEAPSHVVRALFGELKPLLKSKNISCIFTSREDSRVVRTVLPTAPCATLRLVPLSPGWVRALARNELVDELDVAAFSDDHRAMASRATGSFMWTPFAVRAALQVWKGSRELGSTLGDLLDAIVSARAERDLEIPSQDPSLDLPRESVLAMASSMAYEMLVVGGRAACSVNDIGIHFRRAMVLCSNVFGADGMNSRQFIGLLRKHDLVQQTADESFRWSHQLVAGALASRHLALNWRQHIRSLQQPLSDDAWVFAARHVPDADLDDFLRELFQADLMLGARATAELPARERDRGLQYIEEALQTGQPEGLQVVGFFALARVGTERAISFLRRTAENFRSEFGFVAARALAYSGDRLFLLNLLAEVDRCRQIGWGMSGGEIAIWEEASFADRIAIARERLSLVAPGEPVNESVNLIGCETSKEDILLLEAHLRAAKDITAWSVILRAIRNGDHDRAQKIFEEALLKEETSVGRAVLMKAGHEIGLSIDADAAFSLLMVLSSEELKDVGDMGIRYDLARRVLGDLTITMNIRCIVENELPVSTGERKASLWQMATRVESSVIALVALDAFENDLDSVGVAANFFLAHQSLRSEHCGSLKVVIDRYLQDKENWFTFNSWRALTLAVQIGLTAQTLELIQSMILRLVELLEFSEGGMVPAFDEAESHIAKDFSAEYSRYRLEEYARYLVPAAVGACGLLPPRVLVKFLHFNLASSSLGKEVVNLYREMPPGLVDEELESVQDAHTQLAGLEIVCELGLTDRRLELLRAHLRDAYCHPVGLSSVKKSLEKCWNSSVCAMVVETISDFELWPHEWQQFFWDFIRMVSARITIADRALIESHLPQAKTDFAKRILRIWRQMTLDSRVGLSRSELEG
ncbi:MAG: restriction endonuclease [Alcanivoracaceae bacterium]